MRWFCFFFRRPGLRKVRTMIVKAQQTAVTVRRCVVDLLGVPLAIGIVQMAGVDLHDAPVVLGLGPAA